MSNVMKKTAVIILSFILSASALFVPVAAGEPKLDPSESLVTGHAVMQGLGFNGGKKIRDKEYAAEYDLEAAGGSTIVTKKSADEAVSAGQIYLWSLGTSSATGACGFVVTNPDALVNIKGEEGAPDSVYCAMLKIEIDSGICELPVGSFCIAMGPDSARWGKKLNGFDVWLGTGQDPSSGDCELAYRADNLVTLGLWETSPDGKYCYFEADFAKPFAAGYAVLALTKDNLLTTHESFIPGSAPEEKTLYSFLLGEFAVFGKTLDGKDLYEETSTSAAAEESTSAHEETAGEVSSDAVSETAGGGPAGEKGTEPSAPSSGRPDETGPAKEERGCSSAASAASLAAVLAAAPLMIRKKRYGNER